MKEMAPRNSVVGTHGAELEPEPTRDTVVVAEELEPMVPAYEKLGIVPMREGPNLPSMAPNSLYPTRDGGYVLIAANSNPTFARLATLMQQPGLLTDPRFDSIRIRGEKPNMKALDAIVAEWTRPTRYTPAATIVAEWTLQFDGEALEALLLKAEVPSARAYTIADIYRDPQFAARGMLQQVPHPTLGHTTQAGVVPRLSATPGRIRHTGPSLGADTEAVRREVLASQESTR